MAIQITAVQLSPGGTTHQHIVRLRRKSPATGSSGDCARAEIVKWIEEEDGEAYTDDGRGHRADVLVVTPVYGDKCLRSYADGVWTDNLLVLPRYGGQPTRSVRHLGHWLGRRP
jgi:hypothetical protein